MAVRETRKNIHRLGAATGAVLLLSGLSSCLLGGSDGPKFGVTCNIASDQRGSFMSRAENFPIEVIADSQFSHHELNAISASLAEWNSTGEKLADHKFFNFSVGHVPEFVRVANPKDCARKVGSEAQFYIVRETEMQRWRGLGFNQAIPGATIRCDAAGELSHQVVFINPELIADQQVGSVVLHELGHSLGLDHSCAEGAGRDDFIACFKVKTNHPYREAVMYPTLRIQGAGTRQPFEIKESLRKNDYERAECLFSTR